MNYKVTFCKNEMEILTERKANFVNQLKKTLVRINIKNRIEMLQKRNTSK